MILQALQLLSATSKEQILPKFKVMMSPGQEVIGMKVNQK